MTVLVTGSSGFVGLNLLESLLSSGEAVVGFSKDAPPSAFETRLRALPGSLHLVSGDVRDQGMLESLLADHKITTVVHLAAVTAAPERERRQAKAVLDVNLGGLAAVLTACAALKVKRFIYVSSIAVFGPDTADGALLEEETPHDPRTLYALTKSTGEAVVARLGDLLDLDWTVARIGRVFGPFEHETGERDTMSQIYQVMRSASEGRPVRFARPCFKNWNYAKDVGEDLARLARAEGLALRTYNLGSPHRWSLEDWCERLAAVRPGFRFTIDEAAPSPEAEDRVIDLMGQRDGALLSWARFQAAFPTRASHDLDAAFDDYLRFLDLQAKS